MEQWLLLGKNIIGLPQTVKNDIFLHFLTFLILILAYAYAFGYDFRSANNSEISWLTLFIQHYSIFKSIGIAITDLVFSIWLRRHSVLLVFDECVNCVKALSNSETFLVWCLRQLGKTENLKEKTTLKALRKHSKPALIDVCLLS